MIGSFFRAAGFFARQIIVSLKIFDNTFDNTFE